MLNIREITAILSAVIMFGGGVHMAGGIYRNKYSPSLSARIIFLGLALISLSAFVVDGNRDFVGAVVLLTDIVMTTMIGIAIIARDGLVMSLQRFERFYLFGAAVILIIWRLTSDAFLAFILTQVLVLTGCAPVVQKMFVFKRNTESLPAWLAFFISFLLGSYPAYIAWTNNGEILSLVYTLRGVVCIGIIILCALYF